MDEEVKSRQNRPLLFCSAWIVFVVILLVCADYLLGIVNDTQQVRETSRLFREEVAPLQIHTLNLVPDLRHSYVHAERPPEERMVPEGAPRTLETNKTGIILNRGPGRDGPINQRTAPSRTILFLGGSTTECNEVDEPFRFPAIVERLLQNAGANVQVLNGSVRGHTTQDSINTLLNRGEFRKADFIVLMHNVNDRARLTVGLDYAVPLGSVAPTTTDAVEASFSDFWVSIWDWLSYRSNILFIVRMAASHFDPWSGRRAITIDGRTIDFADKQILVHLQEFETNLKIFVSVVRILGRTPVLMTQPLGVASVEQQRYNAVIRKVASAESIHLLDLEAELGARPK